MKDYLRYLAIGLLVSLTKLTLRYLVFDPAKNYSRCLSRKIEKIGTNRMRKNKVSSDIPHESGNFNAIRCRCDRYIDFCKKNDLLYGVELKGEWKAYIRAVEVVDLVPKTEPTIAAAIKTDTSKLIGIINRFLRYQGRL